MKKVIDASNGQLVLTVKRNKDEYLVGNIFVGCVSGVRDFFFNNNPVLIDEFKLRVTKRKHKGSKPIWITFEKSEEEKDSKKPLERRNWAYQEMLITNVMPNGLQERWEDLSNEMIGTVVSVFEEHLIKNSFVDEYEPRYFICKLWASTFDEKESS